MRTSLTILDEAVAKLQADFDRLKEMERIIKSNPKILEIESRLKPLLDKPSDGDDRPSIPAW